MNDVLSLFLVVYALYLVECIVLTRRNATVFVTQAAGAWRTRHPWIPFAGADWGLGFANPLPPLETAFSAEPWPFSVSPRGFLSGAVHLSGPPARRVRETEPIPIDAKTDIAVELEALRLNRRTVAKFGSCAAARDAAEFVRKFGAAANDERPIVLAAAAAHSLSETAVRSRIDEYRHAARALAALSAMQFAFALVIVPAAAWYFGLASTWPWLLAGFAGLWVSIIAAYYAAHRRLYPKDGGERFTGLTLLLLTPLATIRARDLLGRRLLCAFHPLAVARALLDDAGYRSYAEIVLRDARYPTAWEAERDADRRWFAAEALAAIERHLRRNGLDAASLLTAPTAEDASRRAYCPRCRVQFDTAAGACSGCGVALQPLAGSREVVAAISASVSTDP